MAGVQDMKTIEPGRLPLVARIAGYLMTSLQSTCEKEDKMRLVSIGISHYVEKVRWVLDMTGEEYSEDAHLPGAHVFFSYPSSHYTSSMTPLLLFPKNNNNNNKNNHNNNTKGNNNKREKEAMIDSTRIMKELARRYPDRLGHLYDEKIAEEIEEWEEYFDQEIGVPARRLAYSFFLPHPIGKQLMIKEVAWIERICIHLIYPLVRMKITRALDIPADTQSRSLCDDQIMAAFRRVEERLSDGREYLCGDHFSSADLTLAALSYPLIFPNQYAHLRLPPIDQLPDGFVKLMKKYRETAAGRHVIKLYSLHRIPPSLPGPRYVTAQRYVNPFLRNLPFFLFLSFLLLLFIFYFYFF